MILTGLRPLASVSVLLCGVSSAALAQDVRNYRYDVHGRLVEQSSEGAPNDDEVHSICYDAAGNRTQYRTSTDGSTANCDAGTAITGGTPTPSPTPTPTPTPSNSPPSTATDYASGECATTVTVNLTVNDSDPEGDYPLQLMAITQDSGAASASVASASSALVQYGPQADNSVFTYTVTDSLGNSSTGTLHVDTLTCGGPPL